MIGLITLPFRLAFGSVRIGWKAGRLVGPSRALFFGIGFGVGVLAASPKARALAFEGAGKAREAIAEARQVEPTPPEVGVEGPVDGPVAVTE
jgi:hypothetical protein